MKMPAAIFLTIFTVIFGSSYAGICQATQYVSLYNTNGLASVQYALMTNQVVSLVGTYNMDSADYVTGNNINGTKIHLPYPSTGPFQVFTGLTNISLQAGNIAECATLQITTPSCGIVVSNYVPADAIVIPTSAAGNVQIILESSPDSVNWTAANPGTYSLSSATNRFFRVRAVLN
jgi:hypothetical protein